MNNKKIATLLSIALLISLTGCGGNSAGNDVPPSSSIESSQAPIETPETPIEPTESTSQTQDPPQSENPTEAPQEPTAEPTEKPKEQVTPSKEPTPEPTQEPTSPPATPAPVNTPAPTPAPTPTPAPVHTHSYTTTKKATCTSEGIETCSCGDTKVIPATGQHDYQPQTIQGTGHYEQIQVGTEQVLVRNETRQYYECLGCGAHHYSYEEHAAHSDPSSPSFSPNCAFARNLIRTESVPVYEEQPVYENRWVEDTPATTIRICSICGQQEP